MRFFPKFKTEIKTDPGGSEKTNQDKYLPCQRKKLHKYIIFKLQKIKDKEKNLERSQQGWREPYL